MYLKKIEIDGFKSFNEKISVDFTSGITSIVGPNGSGKSNILDAILWVLGEQSYKNIRAKSSSDVIFSGGGRSKARSTAEVSLYIDNSDRTLMIDSDEVIVSRKIGSKGENEYRINKEKSRLKDITEMFLDTGIGKSAYSVIGQGKVERIISSSAKEIRSIIEEAASIKKIKLRKSEAEKKLDKVENEIEKISFVEKELQTNVRALEKQSDKAHKYIEVKDKLDKMKKYYFSTDYNESLVAFEENKIEETDLKNTIDTKQKLFEENENELELVNTSREELSQNIENILSSNEEMKKNINSIGNDKVLFAERLEAYTREKKDLEFQIENNNEKAEEKEARLKKLNSDIEILEKELEEKKSQNSEIEEEILNRRINIQDMESELKELRQQVINFEIDKVKFFNEAENSEKRIKSIEKRKSELSGQKNKAIELQNQVNEKIANLDSKIQLNEKDILFIKEELNNKNSEKSELENKLNSLQQKLNEIEKSLSKVKIKYFNLKRMEENNEGFFKGVKAVLNAGIDGVLGPLVSLIEIPEKYERAIEAGISNAMQDILVKDSQVAKKCINYLKQNNLGRATFIPFDTIKVPAEQRVDKADQNVIGIAADLVKHSNKISKAVKLVLGRILVVKDIDTGVKILKQNKHRGNIVTLDGQVLSGVGKITGGEHLKSNSGLILERKRELKTLKSRLDLENKTLEKYENEYETLINNRREIDKNLDEHNLFLNELKQDLDKLKLDKNNLKMELMQVEKNISIIEFEDSEIEENYVEYDKILKNSHEQMKKIENHIADHQAKITEKDSNYEKKKDKLQDIEHENSEKQVDLLGNIEKLKQLKTAQADLQKENSELFSDLDSKKNKLSEMENLIIELQENLKKVSSEFEIQNSEFDVIGKELEEKRLKQKELEKLEKELISNVRVIEKELIQTETKYSRILEKKEKLKSKLEYLKEKLSELDGVKLEEYDHSLQEAKKFLGDAEVEIKSLGTVNLLAIEEYKGLKKRYEFLKEQKDDLIGSKNSLNKLIAEIENNIKINFYDAYNQINKNFNYMCKEILNNSVGSLKLINENDVLESGIELLVKFKNKKAQSLSLLSGGEKSMVAVALIMAIFMYKPSPFTFFDEIEAALDDSNTRRLIRKLKEFTDKSQFILITHNKQTMKESDILYGVTMDKKIGESKILSVKM